MSCGSSQKDGQAPSPPAEVLDYRVIEEVYKTVVVVDRNPVSGRPRVVPVSAWSLAESRRAAASSDAATDHSSS